MYIMAEKCQWGYASTPTNNCSSYKHGSGD